MLAPPSLAGGENATEMLFDPAVTDVTVGAPGGPSVTTGADGADGGPNPALSSARTVHVYVDAAVKFETTIGDADPFFERVTPPLLEMHIAL
jgi:hypothetical protein